MALLTSWKNFRVNVVRFLQCFRQIPFSETDAQIALTISQTVFDLYSASSYLLVDSPLQLKPVDLPQELEALKARLKTAFPASEYDFQIGKLNSRL